MKRVMLRGLLWMAALAVVLGVAGQQAEACSPLVVQQRLVIKDRRPVRRAAKFVLPPYGVRQELRSAYGVETLRVQRLGVGHGGGVGWGALLLLR